MLEEENKSKGQQITTSEVDIAKDNLLNLRSFPIKLSMAMSQSIKIVKQLINTINKVIELVEAALDRKCNIKCFKYSDTSQAIGGCSTLRPVNCYEVCRISSAVYNPFKVMALSRANKESLVFRSPCTEDSEKSDVVFSADSDFKFAQKKPELIQEAIVTVAHHGSDEHLEFYAWLDSQITKKPLLVRSDNSNTKRPGDDFLAIKKATTAYCSICRLNKNPKQLTCKIGHSFVDNNSLGWKNKNSTLPCQCK